MKGNLGNSFDCVCVCSGLRLVELQCKCVRADPKASSSSSKQGASGTNGEKLFCGSSRSCPKSKHSRWVTDFRKERWREAPSMQVAGHGVLVWLGDRGHPCPLGTAGPGQSAAETTTGLPSRHPQQDDGDFLLGLASFSLTFLFYL